MMDRQKGQFVFECDNCGESLYTECYDFQEALYSLRSHDWTSQRVGNVWVHNCGCKSNANSPDR
jgi:hypothetical protein